MTESQELPCVDHSACCEIDRLEEGRCSIIPPRLPRIIVRGEKYRDNHGWEGKISDGVVFWHYLSGPGDLAVVELKGGKVDRDTTEQLQGGANLAELLSKVEKARFGVVLAANQFHPETRKVIDRARVMFKGREYPIAVVRCHTELENAPPWKTPRATRRRASRN
jgi:hypothetical protein